MTTFQELPLGAPLQQALSENGYLEPTLIQQGVITAAMQGRNIVGESQTGTGKTAAFVLPILEKVKGSLRAPQAIVLAPTRELAVQIREEFFKLSKHVQIRSAVVYGGSSIKIQRENLEKGPQIVVATPGRLIDLIGRRMIDLKHVQYFVLDEVDRMLDMGFREDIAYIWAALSNVSQTMIFSATFPNEIQDLITEYVGQDYSHVKGPKGVTVDKIDHAFMHIDHAEKYEQLLRYISDHAGEKVVVFCRTKRDTQDLADKLRQSGHSSGCLHGDMEQRERSRALLAFKEGKVMVFATTDVAARGLNMNDIQLVVNYSVPEDPEAYVHRIGRTGRAGASGKAIMFVSRDESRLLQLVERKNKIKIKQVDHSGIEVQRQEVHFTGEAKWAGRRGGYRGGGGRFRGGNGRWFRGNTQRSGPRSAP